MPAIGRDDNRGAQDATPRGRDASDQLFRPALDESPPDRRARLELRAGSERAPQQRQVELGPRQRSATHAWRVCTGNRDAARSSHHHAVDWQTARFEVRRQAHPAEQRDGSRVDRIAAQLVAWKRRAVDDQDTRAPSRQKRRRDGAGRTRPDDENITAGH
jgi:hypothetical protein